jgi:hypothetical protein
VEIMPANKPPISCPGRPRERSKGLKSSNEDTSMGAVGNKGDYYRDKQED